MLLYNKYITNLNFRIIENDAVEYLFAIDKRSGQLSIKESTVLDVNHLHTENIIFSVEVSTEMFKRFVHRITVKKLF